MTIIAVQGGVMVADSACFQNDLMFQSVEPKIARAPDGSLVGSSGSMGDGVALKAWVRAGMDFDNPPKFSFTVVSDSSSILWLWLKPNGDIYMGDCTMGTWPVPSPTAIGCGGLYLHGLLDGGVPLEEAVERTIERVPYLGGPVQVERIA